MTSIRLACATCRPAFLRLFALLRDCSRNRSAALGAEKTVLHKPIWFMLRVGMIGIGRMWDVGEHEPQGSDDRGIQRLV